MIVRLAFGLGLFLGSMALGWWLAWRGWMPEARASRLVRWVIVGTSPLVLGLSFWHMPLRSVEPWVLPLLGTVVAASTLLPALWYAKRAGLSRPETGSFLECAFFSNLGYLGGFTAFALYGEAAYGLCALYFMFFSPCFYTLGFWIAARFGQGGSSTGLSAGFHDELRLYPFVGMLVGIGLNLARVPRPEPLEWLNHALIPVSTALYLVSVGSQLRLESPRPSWRACVAMSAIKFVYTPAVAWLFASLLGLQGLSRIVVLLEASTPVGVSPLVLPMLFGIDRKLCNALWWFTTIVSIPWFIIIIPILPHL